MSDCSYCSLSELWGHISRTLRSSEPQSCDVRINRTCTLQNGNCRQWYWYFITLSSQQWAQPEWKTSPRQIPIIRGPMRTTHIAAIAFRVIGTTVLRTRVGWLLIVALPTSPCCNAVVQYSEYVVSADHMKLLENLPCTEYLVEYY